MHTAGPDGYKVSGHHIPSEHRCPFSGVHAKPGVSTQPDLPAFFGPMIFGKMAHNLRRAHEIEPIQRRAEGRRAARSRQDPRGRSRQEAQGQPTHHPSLAQTLRPDAGRRCQAPEGPGDQRKKVASPPARREQVKLTCERGLSERRACGTIPAELRLGGGGA